MVTLSQSLGYGTVMLNGSYSLGLELQLSSQWSAQVVEKSPLNGVGWRQALQRTENA